MVYPQRESQQFRDDFFRIVTACESALCVGPIALRFGCWWLEERHEGSPSWGLEDCSLGPSHRRRQDLHEEMLRAKMQERRTVGRERPSKWGVAPGQHRVFAAAKKWAPKPATGCRFSYM